MLYYDECYKERLFYDKTIFEKPKNIETYNEVKKILNSLKRIKMYNCFIKVIEILCFIIFICLCLLFIVTLYRILDIDVSLSVSLVLFLLYFGLFFSLLRVCLIPCEVIYDKHIFRKVKYILFDIDRILNELDKELKEDK